MKAPESPRPDGLSSESAGSATGAGHFSVIVSYRPDWDRLDRLLHTLRAQGVRVVIVDNASNIPPERIEALLSAHPQSHSTWIQNASNAGLGAAQNSGIRSALAQGADHITLLDQDSLPGPGMFYALRTALAQLRAAGHPVFAVGPRLIDEDSGDVVPFIAYENGRKRRYRCADMAEPLQCFSLMASGTTVDAVALDAVGLLDEGLFIEYVDVEWGARARDKGWICFGVPATTMQHNLGDDRMKIVGRLSLPLHSPLRHYYTFRNAMMMQRKPYVPHFWKRADLLRCVMTAPLFIAFAGRPFSQLKMISLGVLHGLRGIQGPYRGRSQV